MTLFLKKCRSAMSTSHKYMYIYIYTDGFFLTQTDWNVLIFTKKYEIWKLPVVTPDFSNGC